MPFLNPIPDLLRFRIRSRGPIPLSDVMALSNAYYYDNGIVLGACGDFITAPEISQLFGEVIGLWVLVQANRLGTDRPAIVELGPGRGTLTSDMIRVFQKQKKFSPSIHFVETSKRLQNFQQHTLSNVPYSLMWHNDFPCTLKSPTLIIANEFFDALPVQQYIRKDGQWQEICVDCDAKSFFFTQRPCEVVDVFPPMAKEGDIFEISKEHQKYARALSSHLKEHSGAALIVDYGDVIDSSERLGDTFQSLRHHRNIHPLSHLGEADLTCHVDFDRLARVFKEGGCSTTLMAQRHFLKAYGFDLRLQALLSSCSHDEQKEDLLSRAHRLIHPSAMGSLFKVLEVLA